MDLTTLKESAIDLLVPSLSSITIRVLEEGYSEINNFQKYRASGTVTHVYNDKLNILVDTGRPASENIVVYPGNVDGILITHWHSDHCGGINKFGVCSVLNAEEMEKRLREASQVDNDFQLLRLSGHTSEDLALVVRGSTRDPIVICGDIYENKADYSLNPNGSSDNPRLKASKKAILALDPFIIIPGHGPPFKIRESYSTSVYGSVKVKEYMHGRTRQWIIWQESHVILVNVPRITLDPAYVNDVVILKPSPQTTKCLSAYSHARIYMSTDVLTNGDQYDTLCCENQPIPGIVTLMRAGGEDLWLDISDQNRHYFRIKDA